MPTQQYHYVIKDQQENVVFEAYVYDNNTMSIEEVPSSMFTGELGHINAITDLVKAYLEKTGYWKFTITKI